VYEKALETDTKKNDINDKIDEAKKTIENEDQKSNADGENTAKQADNSTIN